MSDPPTLIAATTRGVSSHPLLAIGAPVRARSGREWPLIIGRGLSVTRPLCVHIPELATRGVTVYPRQAAARPPVYLLSSPSRRQPEATAPSRNRHNRRGTIDKQGSKGTPHR